MVEHQLLIRLKILLMGFESQIRKIVERMDMPSPGSRQTMLFSATFPSVIQVDYVQEVEKRSHLMQILHVQLANEICGKLALTLAFVETKKGAHALEYWLSMNGFPAIAIHGDKVQMEREQALKSFKMVPLQYWWQWTLLHADWTSLMLLVSSTLTCQRT